MRLWLGFLATLLAAFILADTKYTNRWFHPDFAIRDEGRVELRSFASPVEAESGEMLQAGLFEVALLRVPERRQGRKLSVSTKDYFYCYEPEGGKSALVVVPAGFVSDMASLPAFARAFYDPFDFAEASFVHDYLYAIGEPGMREEADAVLRAMMLELKESARRTFIVHSAVRNFGESGYGLSNDYVFYDSEEGRLVQGETRPPTGLIQVDDCVEALR